MYWSRTGDPIAILTTLLSLGLFTLGGWLLAAHVSWQPQRDRLPVGIALGLTLSIPLTALLAKALPLAVAWWCAAGLVLIVGAVAARHARKKPGLEIADIRAALPSLLAFVMLTALFALINRGLAIYDDYHNLPLISTMAAGDIPPHFYLNPEKTLSYHFGLDLFAAVLVRSGGFFPWSAYDLTNALFLSLALVLGWHWFRRASGNTWIGLLGSASLAFVGGARWVLLALPESILSALNDGIALQGSALATGSNLPEALASPWVIEGGGPVPFPFAHASGVLTPLVQSMTGSGAFPVLIPVILLLILRRRANWKEIVLAGLILAALALTAETVFVVLLLGGIAAALLLNVQQGKLDIRWWVLLLGAGIVALFQGGVLTELARGMLTALTDTAASSSGYDGFALHWPPAVLSVHFGRLSLFDPLQWLVALAELGPVILLGAWVTRCAWRRLQEGDWPAGMFGLGAIVAFALPLVLHYQVERDTTRITAAALTIWMLLGIPWLWKSRSRRQRWMNALLILALSGGAVSGVVLFVVSLQAIPVPQQSYFVGGMDARISRDYWDALPPEAEVFDPLPYRAVTLFGRPVTTHDALRHPLPAFDTLLRDFTPAAAAAYGFDFLYLDGTWYWRLSPEQREAFQLECLALLEEQVDDMGDIRRLYDVRSCRP